MNVGEIVEAVYFSLAKKLNRRDGFKFNAKTFAACPK